MAANSFGHLFQVHTFGESHGPAMGAVIDGMPAGIEVDPQVLQNYLDRRRPGQSAITTSRNEADQVEILSGVFEGKTLGTPIACVVRNRDQRSSDYVSSESKIPTANRIGHADQTWKTKFNHVDHRGGGRSSGRETLSRVIAAYFADRLIESLHLETQIFAYAVQIGEFTLSEERKSEVRSEITPRKYIDQFISRLPDSELSAPIETLLKTAKSDGKSYGGVVELRVKDLPAGMGQPVFHKLKADLTSAMMGIGATTGVEIGLGFALALREGSELYNPISGEAEIFGGIQGGISNGADLILRVAFKPTSSVLEFAKSGRHDPCIVPRAVLVVEAMASLVIADHLLWQRLDILK